MFGNDFTELKRNNARNNFWQDVMSSIIVQRKGIRPKNDLDYFSWPLWYDQTINLLVIKKLQRKNVVMVSDNNMGNNDLRGNREN